MTDYSSNIEVVVNATLAKIKELQNNPDAVLRTIAMAVLPALRHRVHTEGKDSSGGQIGTYSKGYMVVRTGSYKNADKFSKGANKGKNKNSGVFTKKGTTFFTQQDEETVTGKRRLVKIGFEKNARPQYHRTSDTKVILALTSQMENDLSVIQVSKGYGIGYLNPLNFQKSQWCEQTYGKPILSKLTDSEKELALQTAEQFTADYLKD